MLKINPDVWRRVSFANIHFNLAINMSIDPSIKLSIICNNIDEQKLGNFKDSFVMKLHENGEFPYLCKDTF